MTEYYKKAFNELENQWTAYENIIGIILHKVSLAERVRSYNRL